MLRYVPILQDHSSAVVKLGILYQDMPAMVGNAKWVKHVAFIIAMCYSLCLDVPVFNGVVHSYIYLHIHA